VVAAEAAAAAAAASALGQLGVADAAEVDTSDEDETVAFDGWCEREMARLR
jgi:hypothetical protein